MKSVVIFENIDKLSSKQFIRLVFDSKSIQDIANSLEQHSISRAFIKSIKDRINYLCLSDDHLDYKYVSSINKPITKKKLEVLNSGKKVWKIASDEDFKEIVKNSLSNKEIIIKLGLSEKCARYSSLVTQRIKELGIDNTHILQNYRKSLSNAGKLGALKQGETRPKRSRLWDLSDIQFTNLVQSSKTLSEILKKLGYLKISGGVIGTISKRINSLNINDSHLKEGAAEIVRNTLKSNTNKSKISLKHTLIENSNHNRKGLKVKLLNNNLLENKCSSCSLLPIWNDQKLVMVIDHINGVNNDNRIENLRFLCSNCNSQTDTFSGRNLSNKKEKTTSLIKSKNIIRLKKFSLEEINKQLIANSHISRKQIKKIIYTNELLKRECSICTQGEVWQEKPMVLVLDHINGINNDHRLQNLRLLCPNCNSQTDTFNGKNCTKVNKEIRRDLIEQLPANPYKDDLLNVLKTKRRRWTVLERAEAKEIKQAAYQAHLKSREKHDWDKIDLKAMYERIGSCLGVANELGGISDNAIRKRLKKLGVVLNDQSFIGRKTFQPRAGYKITKVEQ